jgi:HlyD family secretion protein
VTEERRVYVRCIACSPEHQVRYLGEQAEVEIVKKVIPAGRYVHLRFVERYDGRSGVVWIVQNGRLAKREVRFGERLLDGRVEVSSGLPPDAAIVADDQTDLREGRAARSLTPDRP